MTTVSLPANSISRSQYEARQGQPMHRTYSLLSQDCPSCGTIMRAIAFADWVSGHGIVITNWVCISAPATCEAARLETTFRLETRVVDEPAAAECRCQAEYVPMRSGHPHADCVQGFCPCREAAR